MDVLVRIGMPVLVKSINWEVQYEKVPVDLEWEDILNIQQAGLIILFE